MLVRVLLILTLAWQPLALRLLDAPSGSETVCERSSCCTTTETDSCCGLVVVQKACHLTGGVCRCAQAPPDQPNPRQEAPLPRSDRDTLTLILSFQTTPNAIDLDASNGPPHGHGAPAVHSLRSHNQTQALLGVWRN